VTRHPDDTTATTTNHPQHERTRSSSTSPPRHRATRTPARPATAYQVSHQSTSSPALPTVIACHVTAHSNTTTLSTLAASSPPRRAPPCRPPPRQARHVEPDMSRSSPPRQARHVRVDDDMSSLPRRARYVKVDHDTSNPTTSSPPHQGRPRHVHANRKATAMTTGHERRRRGQDDGSRTMGATSTQRPCWRTPRQRPHRLPAASTATSAPSCVDEGDDTSHVNGGQRHPAALTA